MAPVGKRAARSTGRAFLTSTETTNVSGDMNEIDCVYSDQSQIELDNSIQSEPVALSQSQLAFCEPTGFIMLTCGQHQIKAEEPVDSCTINYVEAEIEAGTFSDSDVLNDVQFQIEAEVIADYTAEIESECKTESLHVNDDGQCISKSNCLQQEADADASVMNESAEPLASASIDVEEKFEHLCDLCHLGFNGSPSEHLDQLVDNVTGSTRFQKNYLALQKHWSDFNMRNLWVKPFCKICRLHFQGFLKMGIHMRQQSESAVDAAEEDKVTAHLDLLNKFRAFVHGIRDESVSREEQQSLIEQLTCSFGTRHFDKIQLKGTDNEKTLEGREEDKEVEEKCGDFEKNEIAAKTVEKADASSSEAVNSTPAALFRCLVCQEDFRHLRDHIHEAFWSIYNEKEGLSNGHNNHMRGFLGSSFNDLVRVDMKQHTAFCPCCGIHYRMTKSLAKGLFYHLRSKAFAWHEDASERDIHRAKCDEITRHVVDFLNQKMSQKALEEYFKKNFFCPEGGVDLDLGCCQDASKDDIFRDSGKQQHSSNGAGLKRSKTSRFVSNDNYGRKFRRGGAGRGGGGNFGYHGGSYQSSGNHYGGGAVADFSDNLGLNRMTGAGGVSLECSLCSTQFYGPNYLEVDKKLHTHLVETLFAARVGRGGFGFPSHRYWYQLAPQGRCAYCPLCKTRCDNIDSLAFHIASMMTSCDAFASRHQHYELACEIAEKFVGHMKGFLTIDDLSRYIDSLLRGGVGFGVGHRSVSGRGYSF